MLTIVGTNAAKRMRMRSAAFLALGLMFAGTCSHDGARAQTSVAPPVSLAPADASAARPGAAKPARAATNRTPAGSGRETSPSVIGMPQPKPNPAADYDGFSVGNDDDNDALRQAPPPMRSRAARSSPDADGLDQEDVALRRKLMICQNCK